MVRKFKKKRNQKYPQAEYPVSIIDNSVVNANQGLHCHIYHKRHAYPHSLSNRMLARSRKGYIVKERTFLNASIEPGPDGA